MWTRVLSVPRRFPEDIIIGPGAVYIVAVSAANCSGSAYGRAMPPFAVRLLFKVIAPPAALADCRDRKPAIVMAPDMVIVPEVRIANELRLFACAMVSVELPLVTAILFPNVASVVSAPSAIATLPVLFRAPAPPMVAEAVVACKVMPPLAVTACAILIEPEAVTENAPLPRLFVFS